MDHFMEDALSQARLSKSEGEVPVGCVFVYRHEIIASGGNLVNATKNATRHAEFVCIDKTLEFCKKNSFSSNDVFRDVSVIVTVEPCIMCSAALHQLNVKEIIYGCANDRFGGKTVLDVANIFKQPVHMRGGVRSDDAMQLLKDFYKGENPAAPISKVKQNLNT